MKKSIFTALFILIIATLWILSGMRSDLKLEQGKSSNTEVFLEEQAQKDSSQAEKKLQEVRVRTLKAEAMNDTVEITGRTQASRQVVIRSEAEGQIATLNVQKGEQVTKGQILAKLAVRDRAARLEEAKQLLKQRQIQYNAAKELAEKGFNSRVRLAEKEAELKSARAQVKQQQDQISRIIIRAPFGGIINKQMIEIGDYVTAGREVFEIVDLNPIEVVGNLTEKQIVNLREGDEANAILLNNRTISGTVSFIAAAADINTRTFEMEMTVANDDQTIKEGLTAKILVPYREGKAFRVSPSVLSLSDNGTVGVKIVNAQNIVEFKPVQLLKDTPDYLWISGLPDTVTLITVGQEFVVTGQKVTPIKNNTKNAEPGSL